MYSNGTFLKRISSKVRFFYVNKTLCVSNKYICKYIHIIDVYLCLDFNYSKKYYHSIYVKRIGDKRQILLDPLKVLQLL